MLKLFAKMKHEDENPYDISGPCDGVVIPLRQVQDEVFASESMGKGLAIQVDAKQAILYAPISGRISVLFPTLHAIGITTDTGIELLLHIGIDTVELQGAGFTSYISCNQKIRRGDKLMKVDFASIQQAGYDNEVIMVITNTNKFSQIEYIYGEKKLSDTILHIQE